jgi:phosphoribosyl 1,2-cyclic phosphate phosphodiesterase
MSTLKITILGCGSSGGVPRVGIGWGECDPNEPRNRRRRCALLVERFSPEGGRTAVLIDAGPDLREQLLSVNCHHLDAVLLTHDHADHVHGIDDLRGIVLKNRKRLAVYMDMRTSTAVLKRFGYAFYASEHSDYPPIFTHHDIVSRAHLSINGEGGTIDFLPFDVHHGQNDALGFRIADIAYTPDLHDIPQESFAALEDLDCWIVDALRYQKHVSHFNLEDALLWIDRLKPHQAILTNLHLDMDYNRLCAILPESIRPAYDGLEITTKL